MVHYTVAHSISLPKSNFLSLQSVFQKTENTVLFSSFILEAMETPSDNEPDIKKQAYSSCDHSICQSTLSSIDNATPPNKTTDTNTTIHFPEYNKTENLQVCIPLAAQELTVQTGEPRIQVPLDSRQLEGVPNDGSNAPECSHAHDETVNVTQSNKTLPISDHHGAKIPRSSKRGSIGLNECQKYCHQASSSHPVLGGTDTEGQGTPEDWHLPTELPNTFGYTIRQNISTQTKTPTRTVMPYSSAPTDDDIVVVPTHRKLLDTDSPTIDQETNLKTSAQNDTREAAPIVSRRPHVSEPPSALSLLTLDENDDHDTDVSFSDMSNEADRLSVIYTPAVKTREFAKSDNVHEHEQASTGCSSHTGSSWSCYLCSQPRVFSSERALNMHVKRFHMHKKSLTPAIQIEAQNRPERWKCLLCSRYYLARGYCHTHIMTKHGFMAEKAWSLMKAVKVRLVLQL